MTPFGIMYQLWSPPTCKQLISYLSDNHDTVMFGKRNLQALDAPGTPVLLIQTCDIVRKLRHLSWLSGANWQAWEYFETKNLSGLQH